MLPSFLSRLLDNVGSRSKSWQDENVPEKAK